MSNDVIRSDVETWPAPTLTPDLIYESSALHTREGMYWVLWTVHSLRYAPVDVSECAKPLKIVGAIDIGDGFYGRTPHRFYKERLEKQASGIFAKMNNLTVLADPVPFDVDGDWRPLWYTDATNNPVLVVHPQVKWTGEGTTYGVSDDEIKGFATANNLVAYIGAPSSAWFCTLNSLVDRRPCVFCPADSPIPILDFSQNERRQLL